MDICSVGCRIQYGGDQLKKLAEFNLRAISLSNSCEGFDPKTKISTYLRDYSKHLMWPFSLTQKTVEKTEYIITGI